MISQVAGKSKLRFSAHIILYMHFLWGSHVAEKGKGTEESFLNWDHNTYPEGLTLKTSVSLNGPAHIYYEFGTRAANTLFMASFITGSLEFMTDINCLYALLDGGRQ